MTKYNGAFYHAGLRLRDRYDMEYTNQLRLELIALILSGESVYFKKEKGDRYMCLIQYDGRNIFLIYDSNIREIITFLPNPSLRAEIRWV